MTQSEQQNLLAILNPSNVRDKVGARLAALEYVKNAQITEEAKGKRTSQQNRAMHMDMKLIAEKLNDAGLDIRKLIKQELQIPWTTENVKEYLWKPIMKALYQIESTTELAKTEGQIDKVHEVLMRELGEKHQVEWHDFPHDPEKAKENIGGYKTKAGQSVVEYPEHTNTSFDET